MRIGIANSGLAFDYYAKYLLLEKICKLLPEGYSTFVLMINSFYCKCQ